MGENTGYLMNDGIWGMGMGGEVPGLRGFQGSEGGWKWESWGCSNGVVVVTEWMEELEWSGLRRVALDCFGVVWRGLPGECLCVCVCVWLGGTRVGTWFGLGWFPPVMAIAAIAATAAATAAAAHADIQILGNCTELIDCSFTPFSFRIFFSFLLFSFSPWRSISLAFLSPPPVLSSCMRRVPSGWSVREPRSIHFPSLAPAPLRIALRPRPPVLYIRLLR
ncbi:hypothetical protein BO94DRAFT_246375 [Aspergillus sclerotioniger CBS 115572]|uniref:Uncharacterized protein n=1 Tax=Aspergillus sclerotioniger CBS 115572 TaxID=1450535 RepID=A0A317VI02_9EURO|nr:hypothetical protein BO94DRAFT_246375 [Aspergillus sclerotioniger CBS 115572]PWY72512.1 hypothetical protein BO94DRAFT_246375 [Aspergillus sclerotioniger CBS 115572]